MPSRTSMLHVRVGDDTKVQARAALDAMGLSTSDAVRLFLKRVVADQAFPLELKVPNALTRAARASAPPTPCSPALKKPAPAKRASPPRGVGPRR